MNDDDEVEDPEIIKLQDTIYESIERIQTREDLVEFVELLAKGYEKGAFEFTDLFDFLRGVADTLDGLPGLCANTNRPVPKQLDWRWVGEVLLSGML